MASLSTRCCWATNACFFRTGGICSIWRLYSARLVSQAKSYSCKVLQKGNMCIHQCKVLPLVESELTPAQSIHGTFAEENSIGLYQQSRNLAQPIYGGKSQTFVVEFMAAKNSKKRFIKPEEGAALETNKDESIERQANGSSSKSPLSPNSNIQETLPSVSISVPSRGTVLQACSVTSGLLAALGIIIRQVSHAAFMEGLPVNDCTTQVSFGFEMWHLELITVLVVLISSSRYVLLKTWPDFAESSQAANQQVLTSLEPVDYLVVAFLPGISEELLFRGAMIPALGLNWASVLVVATIFGALHLGSGRKYSFAIWATFVGVAYGYATVVTGSVAVPVVSHALNNLVGGLLWRYEAKLSK